MGVVQVTMYWDARRRRVLCEECAETQAGADLTNEDEQVYHQLAPMDRVLSRGEVCEDCGHTHTL